MVEFMVRCMVFYLFLKYPTLSGPKNRRRAAAQKNLVTALGLGRAGVGLRQRLGRAGAGLELAGPPG